MATKNSPAVASRISQRSMSRLPCESRPSKGLHLQPRFPPLLPLPICNACHKDAIQVFINTLQHVERYHEKYAPPVRRIYELRRCSASCAD